MCGINGIFAYHNAANAPFEAELLATRDHMRARGPDGAGLWWSRNKRLGLGHRRLSIIDLSNDAKQPMVSADGRYTIVFNGEIYNYRQVREQLRAEGVNFRTHSDTEVLLQLYARRGRAMMDSLRGMYAFAIWDDAHKGMFLARDPYGIKPLYTVNDGWTFRFASQVKALLAGNNISRDPEPAGIVGFHLFGHVPEPFTLFRDIRALPAGHSQWVDWMGPQEPKAFVSIAAELARGAEAPAHSTELTARVREAALDSVRAHLVADVEVGVFLSAGVDSGAILGLMHDAGHPKAKAITLAFDEFTGTDEDESLLAAEIATYYGAEHIVRRVTQSEFIADLPAILEAMDQPSIDGVNTWFVAKSAREAGLKVALSGLGGDELLAGYPSFVDIPRWVSLMRVPNTIPGLGSIVRKLAAPLAGNRPKLAGMMEYGGSYPGAYLLRRGLHLPFELPGLLDRDTVRDGLRRLNPLKRLSACLEPDPGSAIARVATLEAGNYMKNQLLRDADWAGMSNSLEIRTPLVDFVLLQALASIVPALTPDSGKAALARAPSLRLPSTVTDRPKTGFGVPTGHWLSNSGASKGAASRRWGQVVFTHQYSKQPLEMAT